MKSYERDDLLKSLIDLGDVFINESHVVHVKFYKTVKG